MGGWNVRLFAGSSEDWLVIVVGLSKGLGMNAGPWVGVGLLILLLGVRGGQRMLVKDFVVDDPGVERFRRE